MAGNEPERARGAVTGRRGGGRRVAAAAAITLCAIFSAAAGGAAYSPTATPTATTPSAPSEQHREFMFEVLAVRTPNQGGQTLNLFFVYRYTPGIAERDIPDYRKLRTSALEFLKTADLSQDPYWETLNHELCGRLKTGYPLAAISCQMQVVGNDDPNHYEPGYHSSVETIGDITPLRIPGPAAAS